MCLKCLKILNYCYVLRARIINPFLAQGKWKFVLIVLRIFELSDKELWNEFPVVFTKAFPRNLYFTQIRENSNCWAIDLAHVY